MPKKHLRSEIRSAEAYLKRWHCNWVPKNVQELMSLQRRLEEVLSNCRMAELCYVGIIHDYYAQEKVQATVVASLATKRLIEVKRELEGVRYIPPSTTVHEASLHQRNRSVSVQRAVKRKQRQKALSGTKSRDEYQLPEADEVLALEESHKERIPHRRGFGDLWVPTRLRYWRPVNNNWKQHGHRQKQWDQR